LVRPFQDQQIKAQALTYLSGYRLPLANGLINLIAVLEAVAHRTYTLSLTRILVRVCHTVFNVYLFQKSIGKRSTGLAEA
jgi:hypothetical protein